MAERNTILACIIRLGQAYPKEAAHHAQQQVVELWVEMLSDLPDDALTAATRECIANLTWFPKIAEIRQHTFDILQAANPTPDPHAAWAEVQIELQRVGHYAGKPGYELRFSNPLIEQTAMTIGWQHLCASENPISDRAQFIQAYQSLTDRARIENRALPTTKSFIQSLQAGAGNGLLPG